MQTTWCKKFPLNQFQTSYGTRLIEWAYNPSLIQGLEKFVDSCRYWSPACNIDAALKMPSDLRASFSVAYRIRVSAYALTINKTPVTSSKQLHIDLQLSALLSFPRLRALYYNH